MKKKQQERRQKLAESVKDALLGFMQAHDIEVVCEARGGSYCSASCNVYLRSKTDAFDPIGIGSVEEWPTGSDTIIGNKDLV